MADWSAHKRERLPGATASALYLDAVQADALIRSDECGSAADLLDRIGENGLRLGKLMRPGLLETKWVLAAVKLGRYEQATRVLERVLAIRSDAVTLRISAGLEFLVSGDFQRYADAERRAEAAQSAGDSEDRRRLLRQGAAVVLVTRGDSASFERLRAATDDFVLCLDSSEGSEIDRVLSLAELGRWAVVMGRGDVVDEVAQMLVDAPTSPPHTAGKLVEFRGLRLGLDGDLDGARRALDEVRLIARARDYGPLSAETYLADATVAAFAGDPAAAQTAVGEAVDRYRSMGSLGGVRECETVARLIGLYPPELV